MRITSTPSSTKMRLLLLQVLFVTTGPLAAFAVDQWNALALMAALTYAPIIELPQNGIGETNTTGRFRSAISSFTAGLRSVRKWMRLT